MFAEVTLNSFLVPLMITIAVREFLIVLLPRSVAGPTGWLIRVSE